MFFIISLLLSLSLSLLFLMTSFPCPVWLSVRKEVFFKINFRHLKCSLGSLSQIWTSWPKLWFEAISFHIKLAFFSEFPTKFTRIAIYGKQNFWCTISQHCLMQYFSNIINDVNWVSNPFYVLNRFDIQMSWLMMVCVQ